MLSQEVSSRHSYENQRPEDGKNSEKVDSCLCWNGRKNGYQYFFDCIKTGFVLTTAG